MKVLHFINNRRLGRASANDSLDLESVLERLKCSSDNVLRIPSKQGPSPNLPLQVRFCPVSGQEQFYIVTTEEGNAFLLDSNQAFSKRIVKKWSAHNNAIFDVAWIEEGKVVTGSGDKTAAIWDLATGQQILTCKGHGCSIKSISLQPANHNNFTTGARDGKIMLWDMRCQNQKNILVPKFMVEGAHDGASAQLTPKQKRQRISVNTRIVNPLNSVASVLFQDEYLLLSAGCNDSKIKGWDLRFVSTKNFVKTSCVFEVSYPGPCSRPQGHTSLVLHPNKSTFFANCTDSVIYQYSCSNRKPVVVSRYQGHKVSTFFVKMDVSYDGRYLLSGSTDCNAYIWKISKPGSPILQLKGHEAEVTSVAWSRNQFTKLISCSDDENIFQWEIEDDLSTQDSEDGKRKTCGRVGPYTPKETSLLLSTPKAYPSPITPSRSSSLVNWLTPKGLGLLTPPTTPSELPFTPVKSRSVLSDLGQAQQETFTSIKKRLVDEKATRRMLNLEENSARLQDRVVPSKENCTKTRGPKRNSKSSNQQPSSSCGIKRFFTVVTGDKNYQ